MTQTEDDGRLDYPATGRNRDAILDVLKRVLPDRGMVLEIGSGTGQHAAYFAPNLPALTWQTSDPDAGARRSIAAWIEAEAVSMPPPLAIDATDQIWAAIGVTAVVSINMIHIAPWSSCLGLIRNAGTTLPKGGILYLYGPFQVGGVHTATSNAEFDLSLRSQNSEWGVRNLDDVAELALEHGFQLAETVRMPANNLSVIFHRKA